MSEGTRAVLTKFIHTYRNLRCLWDPTAALYKNSESCKKAWEKLITVLKAIEPDANVATAKTKIYHLKSSYIRERKRVKESIKRGAKGEYVHVPNLWYYNLLGFLDRKTVNSSVPKRKDTDEDDDDETISSKRRKQDKKQDNIQDSVPSQTPARTCAPNNTFGVYVGEKLDETSPGQRVIAEKLISEIIFLAKINNLSFETRIDNPSRLRQLLADVPQSSTCDPLSASVNESPLVVHVSENSQQHISNELTSPSYDQSGSTSPTLPIQNPTTSTLASLLNDDSCSSAQMYIKIEDV